MPQPLALIVDDEPAVRALVTLILQRYGFATLEAGDGEEALRLLRELGPRPPAGF